MEKQERDGFLRFIKQGLLCSRPDTLQRFCPSHFVEMERH